MPNRLLVRQATGTPTAAMIDWHLDVQTALMDLLYWFLIACFGIGAVAILLDVFLPRNRDE